jgi:hypothetical protein
LVLILVLILVATGGRRGDAMTIMPPRDIAELASTSDAVVVARAGVSTSIRRDRLIFTHTELVVEESVDGVLALGKSIRVRCPGGRVDGESWTVPGSPRFDEGGSYFLCLHRRDQADGSDEVWIPTTLSYGLLVESGTKNGNAFLAPVPESRNVHPLSGSDEVESIGTYARPGFVDHLRKVLSGAMSWDSGRVLADAELVSRADARPKGVPAGCEYIPVAGRNTRWSVFDSGGVAPIFGTAGGDLSLTGGGLRELAEATASWMDVTGTNINPLFEGELNPTFSCSGAAPGNFVFFNDPCDGIAPLLSGCRGVLALGGPFETQGSHVFDNLTWTTITNWVVVVNSGTGCLGSNNYRIMLTHELGHGLGFGHVADTGALMFESCCNEINGTDSTCSRFTYPRISANNARPTIDTGPDRTLSLATNDVVLRASVTDDELPTNGSLELRWRRLAGPGQVTFSNPEAAETAVSFSLSGTYLLGMSAHDGELLGVDFVEVTVDIFALRNTERSFAHGENGYFGARDTYLWERNPTTLFSSELDLVVDGNSPDASNQQKHALIGFEEVFGFSADQVPDGAPISSARLELSTLDFGDGAAVFRMLEPWTTDDSWSTFDPSGIEPGDQAFGSPDAVVDGRASAVNVDVTRSLQAWSSDTCSVFGWAMLPIGTNGWGFSSSRGPFPPRLVVQYSPFVETLLIQPGDEWNYLKGFEDIPSDWNETEFIPDDVWLSGPTGIGYGDADDATVLSDMRGNYVTIYCRRLFEIENPVESALLLLRMDYDDGFVAYVNGVEVARSSSLEGAGSPPSPTTTANRREAGATDEFVLDPSTLRPGTNVLAIQVHNATVSSSDLSFIPELVSSPFLVGPGEEWRFLRGSEGMPEDWQSIEFDEAGWEVGAAGFGYGDGDDTTELDDMQHNYLFALFRKTLEVESRDDLLLTLIHDDGVVVHVNGTEIGRANMPTGTVNEDTRAQSNVETALSSFPISRESLRIGSNVVAISIHNASLSSDDLSFHPFLGRHRVSTISEACQPDFRRGDVDDSGFVDLSDPINNLSFLLLGTFNPQCLEAADTDNHGAVDITDPIINLTFQLLGGNQIPAPGPFTCGPDPAGSSLGCASYTSCGP